MDARTRNFTCYAVMYLAMTVVVLQETQKELQKLKEFEAFLDTFLKEEQK